MFHLILPANFKKKDASAELFAVESEHGGHRVSYRHLNVSGDGNSISSEPPRRLNSADSGGTWTAASAQDADEADEDGDGGAGGGRGARGGSLASRLFRRGAAPAAVREVVYMFHVMLDGNEKALWLTAAAEMGRLCEQSAVTMSLNTTDFTR